MLECNRSKLLWNQISGSAFLSTLLPENYLHPWCSLMLCPLRSRGSGVTVAVLLSWEPPREGDLPVRNYRVTWTDRNTHTTHKHTHTFHAQARNNMHTLPTHSRPVEQGKKENNARVTHGVRDHFNNVYIIYKVFDPLITLWCKQFYQHIQYSILIGYIQKILSVRRNKGCVAFLNVHVEAQKPLMKLKDVTVILSFFMLTYWPFKKWS